jgi:hypothetical protein
LHAKLLETHAAAVREPNIAIDTAREAIDVLEDILDSLLDLSATLDDKTDADYQSLYGPDVMDAEIDMKRKLAITSLILKMNVWLLDALVASDLLDLVVSDQLSGTRGVLMLPSKNHVRLAVAEYLEKKIETLDPSKTILPVLETTAQFPKEVLTCCQMALIAKSKGRRVSDWFESFRLDTVRQIGQPESGASVNKELLISLFITFVYISCPDGVYIGPLSLPIVPRKFAEENEVGSRGKVYTDWETSATLYCIEHGLHPSRQSN